MNEALRKLLEKRGLSPEATEDEAWAFYVREKKEEDADPESARAVGSALLVDEVEEKKKAIAVAEATRARYQREEMERIEEIRGLEASFGFPELADQLIKDGVKIAEARRQYLEATANQKKHADGAQFGGRLVVTADERDKFREAAAAGMLVRMGHAAEVENESLRSGHDLIGMPLNEMRRKANVIASLAPDTPLHSRAIASSDLPYILGDVQNKIVAIGYQGAEVTWRPWCATRAVSNLHTINMPIVSSLSKAQRIDPDDGEYKFLSVSDAQETTDLEKLGGILRVSDKVILNDNMMEIETRARNLGDVLARAVNILVYGDNTTEDPGVIMGSAGVGETMRDSTALFTAGHANYVASGSGAAPTVATLSAAQAAMRKQKDIGGHYPLNWLPRYMMVPAALEGTAQQLRNSVQDPSKSNEARNPFFQVFDLIVEPLLDGGPTGAATRWYMAAAQGRTVFVIFHESTNDRPALDSQPGWYTDGMEWKGHIYATAKAADWRGLYCNYGA